MAQLTHEQVAKMDEKEVELSVQASIQLPHTVHYKGKTYLFAPTAEVPSGFAHLLLQNQPKVFCEEAADKKKYNWREDFKKKTLGDIVDKLSAEGKNRVYGLAEQLLRDESTAGIPQVDVPPGAEKPKGKAPAKSAGKPQKG